MTKNPKTNEIQQVYQKIYTEQVLMCILKNLMDKPSIKKLWYIPT